jgi:hypothetical protein
MARHWLWMVARSIAAGWATLITLTYLAEHPLLRLTAPLVGPHWLATASLTLDCLKLLATGWAIGRLHRAAPLICVVAFAATLALFNLDPWLPLDLQQLIRLAMDAAHDTRYWGPLAAMAAQHILLFGSLFAGALLGRAPQTPLSLFGPTPR